MKDGAKQRHGQGVYTDTLEGHTYEGEWLNDKMHGRGTFRYASNARYEGVLWQGKFYNGVGPGIAGSAQAVAN
eukprot:6198405-Pleurochrysis_carterae.AAC.4